MYQLRRLNTGLRRANDAIVVAGRNACVRGDVKLRTGAAGTAATRLSWELAFVGAGSCRRSFQRGSAAGAASYKLEEDPIEIAKSQCAFSSCGWSSRNSSTMR